MYPTGFPIRWKVPGHLGPGVRLSLFYWCLFLIIGIYLPFWPVWLESRGMTATQIGILLAVGTWVKVFANPVVGHVVDQRGDRRLPMIVLAGAALAFVVLFYGAHEFWALLIVSGLFGFALSSLFPLSDNLTVRIATERELQYGRIRLWGSVSFIVAAMLGGRILEGRPEGLVLAMVIAAVAVTWASTFLLPDARWPTEKGRKAISFRLLMNPVFLLFLASASLIQSSHAVYYGFATLYWRSIGHSDTVIGWLWAEGVIAEVILFMFGSALLARMGPVRLLIIAGLAGLLRWGVTGLTTDLVPLLFVQAIHAFTFGATHLAAVHFIARAAPSNLSASAQSLYAALGTGVGFGITMPLAGYLYAQFGGGAFLFMGAMTLVGAGCAVLLARRWDGEQISL
jgi:PPP family 3-phenylpropionic acid transporter